MPADARTDPAEEVPFTLWEEYLDKLIYPDHKTTPQQRGQIGYTLKLVVDALLEYGRSETMPRFIGALLRYYDRPEEKDEDTAFTLLDAIRYLPAQQYDQETRGRLIRFAAWFAASATCASRRRPSGSCGRPSAPCPRITPRWLRSRRPPGLPPAGACRCSSCGIRSSSGRGGRVRLSGGPV